MIVVIESALKSDISLPDTGGISRSSSRSSPSSMSSSSVPCRFGSLTMVLSGSSVLFVFVIEGLAAAPLKLILLWVIVV